MISVTRVIQKTWPSYCGVPRETLDFAAQRGKFAQQAIEWYDQGDLDEDQLDERLRPYLEAWKQFRADTGYKPICHEYELQGNGFIGHPDGKGKLNGQRHILEIKCTAAEFTAHRVQTSVYHSADPDRDLGLPILLRLKPDRRYSIGRKLKPTEIGDHWRAFQAGLRLVNNPADTYAIGTLKQWQRKYG